jgi:hypothetical protein
MRYPRPHPLIPILSAAAFAFFAFVFSACVVEETPVDNGSNPPASTLPPDPGNAGQQTLVGVDSDGDGLRDDVQIHVYYTYSDAATRKAATQLSKAIQTLIATGSDKPHAVTAATAMNKAIDCLYALDASKVGDRVDDLEGTVVNTESRSKAYAKAGSFLSGGDYTVSTVANNGASCEVNP